MIDETRYSKNINWGLFGVLILLMFIMLYYFDRAVAATGKDPKAAEVGGKMISAMGGMDSWKKVNALRFNFQVEPQGQTPHAVKHLWDRKGWRDHVEGNTKDGKKMVAWIDLNSKKGAAWADGKKLEGEELNKAMDWAYGRWVNDTYWLVMPLKIFDSGVNLEYAGQKDGHDVLHVSFGKVGLTPGDQYWVYVNPSTGMMDQWTFLLEGEKEKETFDWKEYGDYNGVKLSKMKESGDKKLRINFEPLQAMESADAAYFGQELKELP
jgi:hypothetical protein